MMSISIHSDYLRFFLGGPALVANDSIEKCAKKTSLGFVGMFCPDDLSLHI